MESQEDIRRLARLKKEVQTAQLLQNYRRYLKDHQNELSEKDRKQIYHLMSSNIEGLKEDVKELNETPVKEDIQYTTPVKQPIKSRKAKVKPELIKNKNIQDKGITEAEIINTKSKLKKPKPIEKKVNKTSKDIMNEEIRAASPEIKQQKRFESIKKLEESKIKNHSGISYKPPLYIKSFFIMCEQSFNKVPLTERLTYYRQLEVILRNMPSISNIDEVIPQLIKAIENSKLINDNIKAVFINSLQNTVISRTSLVKLYTSLITHLTKFRQFLTRNTPIINYGEEQEGLEEEVDPQLKQEIIEDDKHKNVVIPEPVDAENPETAEQLMNIENKGAEARFNEKVAQHETTNIIDKIDLDTKMKVEPSNNVGLENKTINLVASLVDKRSDSIGETKIPSNKGTLTSEYKGLASISSNGLIEAKKQVSTDPSFKPSPEIMNIQDFHDETSKEPVDKYDAGVKHDYDVKNKIKAEIEAELDNRAELDYKALFYKLVNKSNLNDAERDFLNLLQPMNKDDRTYKLFRDISKVDTIKDNESVSLGVNTADVRTYRHI